MIVVKELKLRPKIEEHDYLTKKRHIEEFLEEGHKVKLTVRLGCPVTGVTERITGFGGATAVM